MRRYDNRPMDARSLRRYTVAATVPAVLVIVAHLAYEWHAHPAAADRRAEAFHHGIALAVVLAAVLAAARAALMLEGRARHAWADALGAAAVIAVLAHLASAWRDDGIGDTRVTLVHTAALAAVAAGVALIRLVEGRQGPG
jgi:hypothetical protein